MNKEWVKVITGWIEIYLEDTNILIVIYSSYKCQRRASQKVSTPLLLSSVSFKASREFKFGSMTMSTSGWRAKY